MKKILVAATVATSMLLAACGGGGNGGGSVSTGGVYYTHDQLAQEFVRRVNTDVAGYSLSLVKSSTLQYDWIVVHDYYYGTDDAYYIGGYSVGMDLNAYLYNNSQYFYYDLIWDPYTNIYTDPITGTQFSLAQESSANLETVQAAAQEAVLAHVAKQLRDQYGMSAEKSADVATVAYQMRTTAKGALTTGDIDSMTKDLIGSSWTEIQNDMKSGNQAGLKAKLEKAASITGMGLENTQKLLGDLTK